MAKVGIPHANSQNQTLWGRFNCGHDVILSTHLDTALDLYITGHESTQKFVRTYFILVYFYPSEALSYGCHCYYDDDLRNICKEREAAMYPGTLRNIE